MLPDSDAFMAMLKNKEQVATLTVRFNQNYPDLCTLTPQSGHLYVEVTGFTRIGKYKLKQWNKLKFSLKNQIKSTVTPMSMYSVLLCQFCGIMYQLGKRR